MLVLTTGAIMLVVVAFSALAAPPLQEGPLIPTPTLFPVTEVAYTVETVGGAEETLTFAHADQEGFTLGETSVTSHYPRGMIFTINPSSENGEIAKVTLRVTYAHDLGDRFEAEWDAERGTWVAHPWFNGSDQPAWTPIHFHWRVRDTAGNYVDTETFFVDYWDPNREWFRVESDHYIMYWHGFHEDDPDTFATRMTEVINGAYPRWVEGFGRELSYKPIAIIYPDPYTLAEIRAGEQANTRIAGFTSSQLGISVQSLGDGQVPPGNENCIWSTPAEERTLEWRIDYMYETTPHEFTHLYQYDVQGSPRGFLWVFEGQAEWFANGVGKSDGILRHLSTLQDIPSLTTDIGWRLPEEDGCTGLAYRMGGSFYNYLLSNYGGTATHYKIVETFYDNGSIYDAVEAITGRPFLEIENEWRAYLGFPPIEPVDLDLSLALQPYDDPLLTVGDTVILPSVPAMSLIYQEPKPNALASGSCWANMEVEILAIGQINDTVYVQVDCMGQMGWMTRDKVVGEE
jgi:hypothetical protein